MPILLLGAVILGGVLVLPMLAPRFTSDTPSRRFAAVLLKRGLDDMRLRPEIGKALEMAPFVAKMGNFGPVVVTSTYDGNHLPNSLHYKDQAVDLRSAHLAPERRGAWARALKLALGPGYDVLSEGPGPSYDRQADAPHIHVEWNPHG